MYQPALRPKQIKATGPALGLQVAITAIQENLVEPEHLDLLRPCEIGFVLAQSDEGFEEELLEVEQTRVSAVGVLPDGWPSSMPSPSRAAYRAQIVNRRSSTLTATFCPRSKPACRNHLPPSRSSGTWCWLR